MKSIYSIVVLIASLLINSVLFSLDNLK